VTCNVYDEDAVDKVLIFTCSGSWYLWISLQSFNALRKGSKLNLIFGLHIGSRRWIGAGPEGPIPLGVGPWDRGTDFDGYLPHP